MGIIPISNRNSFQDASSEQLSALDRAFGLLEVFSSRLFTKTFRRLQHLLKKSVEGSTKYFDEREGTCRNIENIVKEILLADSLAKLKARLQELEERRRREEEAEKLRNRLFSRSRNAEETCCIL